MCSYRGLSLFLLSLFLSLSLTPHLPHTESEEGRKEGETETELPRVQNGLRRGGLWQRNTSLDWV